MSKPTAIFLDTGILLSLFNNNPKEEKIAEAALSFLQEHPHASRHVVAPVLVELFYKIGKAKRMSPKDVQANFDTLGVTLFPISSAQELKIFNSYCVVDYKAEFDYADYFLSSAATMIPDSVILTIDRGDLPLALGYSLRTKLWSSSFTPHLIPLV